jgi:hypothetical protein
MKLKYHPNLEDIKELIITQKLQEKALQIGLK